jgi:GT2 family glycosyltransferase
MNVEHDVTAIVKTFERPCVVRRLVRSIKKFYPGMHLVVADDSFQPSPIAEAEYVRLPPDSGVSAGRNAMLRRVKTPYFLLFDDDNECTCETRIDTLLNTIQEFGVDLAAGNYIRCKQKFLWIRQTPQPFVGTIERCGSHLTISPGYRTVKPGLNLCDIAHNFYVARTQAIRDMGGWADALKTNEHAEFFVRFQQHGLRAAYCPDVTVRHWLVKPAKYAAYRDRDYWTLAAQIMGITKFTGMSGQVREFPAGRGLIETGVFRVCDSC